MQSLASKHIVVERKSTACQDATEPSMLFRVHLAELTVHLAGRQPGELHQSRDVPRDLVRGHIVEPWHCHRPIHLAQLEVVVACHVENAIQTLQVRAPMVLDRAHPPCVEPWALAPRAMALQFPPVAVGELQAQLGQGWVAQKVMDQGAPVPHGRAGQQFRRPFVAQHAVADMADSSIFVLDVGPTAATVFDACGAVALRRPESP